MNAPPALAIARLRGHAALREPIIARLAAEALASEVASALPALPPQSVLMVRRLALAVPGLDLTRLPESRVRQDTARAAHALLTDAYRRAARPACEMVSGQCAAVLFGDEAELLACLARDALSGRLDAWWWRTLLGERYPDWSTAWRDRPAATTAALRLLTRAGLAARTTAELRARGVEIDRLPDAVPPNDASERSDRPAATGDGRLPMRTQAAALGRPSADGVVPERQGPLPAAHVSADLPLAAPAVVAPRTPLSPKAATELPGAGPPAVEPGSAIVTPALLRSAIPSAASPASVALPHASPAPRGDAPSPSANARAAAGDAVAPWPAPADGGSASSHHSATPVRPATASSDPQEEPPTADGTALVSTVGTTDRGPPSVACGTAAAGMGLAASPPGSEEKSRPRRRPADRLARVVAKIVPGTKVDARPPDESDDEVSAFPLASAPQAISSGYGRLLFLVNLLLDDGLYPDFTRPTERGFPVPIWRLLALLGSALAGPALRGDAIWGLLDRLAAELPTGDDCAFDRVWPIPAAPARGHFRPPSEPHRQHLHRTPRRGFARWLARYQLSLRARLAQSLAIPPALVGNALRQQRGNSLLWVSAAEIVVVQALDEHPVAWRLAGLDRDPGYLPSAGRKLRFVFD